MKLTDLEPWLAQAILDVSQENHVLARFGHHDQVVVRNTVVEDFVRRSAEHHDVEIGTGDVAELLGVSSWSVRRRIERGELDAKRGDRDRFRVTKAAVNQHINGRNGLSDDDLQDPIVVDLLSQI